MEWFILSVYIILLFYILNILWLWRGFNKVQLFKYSSTVPKTTFTVVIPFRNEKENLPKLLASIEKLNYPLDLFEVILVDDESTDGWNSEDGRWKVVRNKRKTNSPKKDAINTAIELAKYDWIVTTDADCLVSENWLTTFDAFIQQNEVKMIAGGVVYDSQNNFLENFQQLDLLSLQGTTIGSFGNGQAFMCNGANFCYRKDFFKQLNGFEGNDAIASGDDVFLLQKGIENEPDKVHFLKNHSVIVFTKPEATWQKLFHQRVRWASKIGSYKSFYSKQLGICVFLVNILLITTLVLQLWNVFIYAFAYKTLVDYVLFRTTVSFYRKPLRNLISANLVYMFFSTCVALYSIFGKYNWKGRSFNR